VTQYSKVQCCSVAAGLCLLLAAGCGRGGAVERTIVKEASDGSLLVKVKADVAMGAQGPCVRCEITVKNVGRETLVIFNDRKLPNVMGMPEGLADVFYGMREMPLYRSWFSEEVLVWRYLLPEDDFVYIVEVWNPLDEQGYYGNPWIDDPASAGYVPYEKRDRYSKQYDPAFVQKHCFWRHIRTRVGYLNLAQCNPAIDMDAQRFLSGYFEVVVDGKKRTLFSLQKEVEVRFDVGR
jgi:hypothetical protein